MDSGFYWSTIETKEVYFNYRSPETGIPVKMHFFETCLSASTLQHHHFVKCSNIRGRITDLTRQTYGDVWFDKSTIRHRIFEYSDSIESKFPSLSTCHRDAQ